MLKILNLDPENYSKDALRVLQGCGKVDSCKLRRAELKSRIAEYDAVIMRFAHHFDDELINRATNLKCIGTNVTGLDHIDEKAANEKGVRIISLRGEYEFLKEVPSTAELTWALLLALLRKVPKAIEHLSAAESSKHWDRSLWLGSQIKGKAIGILGVGRVGSMVANYATAFGMRVYGYSSNYSIDSGPIHKLSSIEELLSKSEVLSVHLPLTSETEGLISEKQLELLPEGAYIINTSRPSIIDEVALIKYLKNGRLAGAAIDGLYNENQSEFIADSKLLAYSRNSDKLLITPHIGGLTRESWRATELFIAKKVAKFLTAEITGKRAE